MAKKERNGFHELEFKLDAGDVPLMKAVQAHVLAKPKIFTPTTHPDLLDAIPQDLRSSFQMPVEVTEARKRLYFDKMDLAAFEAGIEIRQERHTKGRVKQMIKIGGNASDDDPLMDRMEHGCYTKRFGVSVGCVKDDDARKYIKKMIGDGEDMKPIVCMISQRTRINYHPHGDPDTIIELGFDYPCRGYSLMGFVWDAPQMELEIVKGPDEHEKARAILEREAARFDEFGLVRSVVSKPTPAFERLMQERGSKAFKAAFNAINIEDKWWLNPARFSGGAKPLAQLRATG